MVGSRGFGEGGCAVVFRFLSLGDWAVIELRRCGYQYPRKEYGS